MVKNLFRLWDRYSTTRMKRVGDKGLPVLRPRVKLISFESEEVGQAVVSLMKILFETLDQEDSKEVLGKRKIIVEVKLWGMGWLLFSSDLN